MKIIIQKELCALVYEHDEWETNYGTESQTILKRCIPNDGVFLYEISATYAKQVQPSKYYFLGTSMKDAKARFTNIMTWMKITNIRLIPPGEEAKCILTNPKTIP